MEYEGEHAGMHYEGNCIRPPSEAMSILLQVTAGCSHNRCTFCGAYRDKRFRIKEDSTIMSDIRFASRHMRHQDRLFLMDGDALIIPQKRLLWILEQIEANLPWVKRVGVYANAKSISMKSPEELEELVKHRLKILYLGIESGDDRVLASVRKGASADDMVQAGRKAISAGMKLSVTVLLGLAGSSGSLEHARATGEVLSRMDPDYIGALTVMLIPGTPLHDDYISGEFQLPSQRELLLELREMIAHTDLSRGLFFSNHASNYLPVKARLPAGKGQALELIDRALDGNVHLKPEWMRAL